VEISRIVGHSEIGQERRCGILPNTWTDHALFADVTDDNGRLAARRDFNLTNTPQLAMPVNLNFLSSSTFAKITVARDNSNDPAGGTACAKVLWVMDARGAKLLDGVNSDEALFEMATIRSRKCAF
jgi:hypothetical protein